MTCQARTTARGGGFMAFEPPHKPAPPRLGPRPDRMNHARVALVTGSGKRRVGWYVADELADRGYDIIIHYHHSAAEAAETVATFRDRGVEAIAIGADLTDESSA